MDRSCARSARSVTRRKTKTGEEPSPVPASHRGLPDQIASVTQFANTIVCGGGASLRSILSTWCGAFVQFI